MAKKKIELFIYIKNEKEFEHILEQSENILICADVYCEFSGPCTVLDHLFTRMKLDWSDGQIVLLKVPADEISAFDRFRNQSRPVFMFIYNRKITKIFRGVDNIRFAEVAKRELEYWKQELDGVEVDRPLYDLDEASPEDLEWLKIREADIKTEQEHAEYRRAIRQSSRKRHRASMMVPKLEQLNFVLFWPHAKHAHPELYERWNLNNIIMIAIEEIELDKKLAEDILYAGDAPWNEASIHALLSGPALAICFRLLDTDKNFTRPRESDPLLVFSSPLVLTELVRKILYEDLPELTDDDTPQQRITAFDMYKSYSPSKEEILRKREEDRIKKKEQLLEQRSRRLSEMQRIARQAIEEAIEEKRAIRERRKLELLKLGNLEALEALNQKPEESVDIAIPEELPDDMESSEEEEDENEYFPPEGLLVPGFYAPPNDIAKANGLAILFPKLVFQYVTPEPEYLPPHLLVMVGIAKRYSAIASLANYRRDILHMGIFKGLTPNKAVHIAYSVKQFDALKLTKVKKVNLAFMVAMESDLALLELMDLSPVYVSRDLDAGEEDCAKLFGVAYGDTYPEFEDFESQKFKLNS